MSYCTDPWHDLPLPKDMEGAVAVYERRQASCAVCETPCAHAWAPMSYETDGGFETAVGCVLCGVRYVADDRPKQGCRECFVAWCACCGKPGHEGEWLEYVRQDYPDHYHLCSDCKPHVTLRYVAGGYSRSSRDYHHGRMVVNRVCGEAARALREAAL